MTVDYDISWVDHNLKMFEGLNKIIDEFHEVIQKEIREIERLIDEQTYKYIKELAEQSKVEDSISDQEVRRIIEKLIDKLHLDGSELELDAFLEFRSRINQNDLLEPDFGTDEYNRRHGFCKKGMSNLKYLFSEKEGPEDLFGIYLSLFGGLDFYIVLMSKIKLKKPELFNCRSNKCDEQFCAQTIIDLNKYKIQQFIAERKLCEVKCSATRFIAKSSYRIRDLKRIIKARISQEIHIEIRIIEEKKLFEEYKKECDDNPTLEKFKERIMNKIRNKKGKKISESTAKSDMKLMGFENKKVFIEQYYQNDIIGKALYDMRLDKRK